jgi:conjugative transfer region protein TrbK
MTRVLVWGTVLLILVGGALVAASRTPPPALKPSLVASSDPQLVRCRELGEAASRDASCRAAWLAARDRFLGGRRP